MYRKFAEERESEGHYEGSIEYWAKSLEAARSAGDQPALGQACYRLGKAYTELEDPTRYACIVCTLRRWWLGLGMHVLYAP